MQRADRLLSQVVIFSVAHYTCSLLSGIVDAMVKTFLYAGQALRLWNTRQVLVAVLASTLIGLLIGMATALIPNPVFTRDIDPVWWNYPVWIMTSVASGMLLATYIQPATAVEQSDAPDATARHGKLGMVGGFLSWFAVGCPVCNKLALIAFGYSGAITYFAPIQPLLGIAALLLTGIALVRRLKGQLLCEVSPSKYLTQSASQETENTRV